MFSNNILEYWLIQEEPDKSDPRNPHTHTHTHTQIYIYIYIYKRNFFQALVVPILLNVYTIWTLTKRMDKKPDGNCPRILLAILKNSLKQHPGKKHMYGYRPPISYTYQIRRTRCSRYCWRRQHEYISDLLQWILCHGPACAGWLTETYYIDTGCKSRRPVWINGW